MNGLNSAMSQHLSICCHCLSPPVDYLYSYHPSSGLVTSHLACHSGLITGCPLVYLSKCRDLAEISPKHGSQQPPHTLLLKCPPDLGQPSHQTLLWIFPVCALGCTNLVNVLPSPPPYTLLALCLNHPFAPNSH